MIVFASLLAFYFAWNLGANDVANSMGTSVGAKVVTLRQALVIAGILEFLGAVLFGQAVSQKLVTGVVDLRMFADTPHELLLGMLAVLIACGIWLNLATGLGLPVSSSHAVVGAIAGFAWVASNSQAVHWQTIGTISLTWVATPIVSGAIAALLYSLVKHWILDQPNPLAQLREWIPWLSAALVGTFGVIVLPKLSQPLQRQLFESLSIEIPQHDLPLLMGVITTISLTFFTWRQLEPREQREQEAGKQEAGKQEAGKQEAREAGKTVDRTERILARFQVLSACCVAFAHGSNDVGNAVAPLAAIAHIQATGLVPLEGFQLPLWVFVLGGSGIVAGLAVWGKQVILTVGEGIVMLQPSGGFCAELATATTVLLASRLGLPVSTSHALVGGVVGIGLIKGFRGGYFRLLRKIGFAWFVTLPISAGLAAIGFIVLSQFMLRSPELGSILRIKCS
jgi:PiT family inorganic phosphate transporter